MQDLGIMPNINHLRTASVSAPASAKISNAKPIPKIPVFKKAQNFGDKIGSFPFRGPDGKIVKTLTYVSDSAMQGNLIINFIQKEGVLFQTSYSPIHNKFVLLQADEGVKMTKEARIIRKSLTPEFINKASYQIIDEAIIKEGPKLKMIDGIIKEVTKFKVPYNLKRAFDFLGRIKVRL